jgi:hypothetical protein
MIRHKIIDAQPIGDLYKRAPLNENVADHATENLTEVRLVLYWEPIPAGRTVHFWSGETASSAMTAPITGAEPQEMRLTIIGCRSGRRGNGKRFRVDSIHGTGIGKVLKIRDFKALMNIIKYTLQEAFPEQNITGITKDVFVLEEKARWDS